MNYEEIMRVARDINEGRFDTERSVRRRFNNELIHENTADDLPLLRPWDERGFHDSDFQPDDYDPTLIESMQDAEQFTTGYGPNQYVVPGNSIYKGSLHSGKDMARYLLAVKARHLKMGDGVFASVVGIMATFLPRGNVLQTILKENPSEYFLLKCIDNLSDLNVELRCIQVDVCEKGCMLFHKDKKDLNFCSECD